MVSKTKTKSKNKFMTIRVNQNILRQVEKIAKEKGVGKSNVIREAIESYLGNKILLDISQEMKEQLDKLSKEIGVSRDQILIEAIYRYLWKERADRVREKFIPVAREKGIVTEEDVSKRIS